MAMQVRGKGQKRTRNAVLLVAMAFCALQGYLVIESDPLTGLAQVTAGKSQEPVTPEAPKTETSFFTKIVAAAAQGATAASVAAVLSAATEPLVNRLLVKRMTFAAAWEEMSFEATVKFFWTTFSTNMLKFPAFEVINMAMSFTAMSGQLRGVVNGFLFCSLMLPVTNYRFRKSMGLEIKPSLLYQAYVPTVCRDILYGWARGGVGSLLTSTFQPQAFSAKCVFFGITVWAACIISSPCNEWRGFTLQPKERALPFKEFFKPINYARSTGIGATIMGISLMLGMLITPHVEKAFEYSKQNPLVAVGGGLVLLCVLLKFCKGAKAN